MNRGSIASPGGDAGVGLASMRPRFMNRGSADYLYEEIDIALLQ